MPEVSDRASHSELSKHTPMMLTHCTDNQPEALQGAALAESEIMADCLLHTVKHV